MERDAAFAAVARARVNFDFVNKHASAFLIPLVILNPIHGRCGLDCGHRNEEIKKARRLASP